MCFKTLGQSMILALSLAKVSVADFYIAGLSGEYFDGYYGNFNDDMISGVTAGESLDCNSFGIGGLSTATDSNGAYLYEVCDVDGATFAWADQCNGQTLVIGGVGNNCGVACTDENSCTSADELGLVYIQGKEVDGNVGTCWYAGPTGWSANCASDGSVLYSELVYCYIDQVACTT